MIVKQLPFYKTGFFSNTMLAYLSKEKLQDFYNNFPDIKGFKKQLTEKKTFFTTEKRQILVTALKKQYQSVTASEQTTTNIELLTQSNTFTVTTRHQLNLFTGHLYFLYIIISAINLAETLKEYFPDSNSFPFYCGEREDYEFLEI